MTSLSSRKLIYSTPPQLVASQSSSTFTISDISQSLSVTPAAIDGVKEGGREQRESVLPCNCFTCDTQNCKSQLKQRPYAFKLFTVAPSLKPFGMSALPQ